MHLRALNHSDLPAIKAFTDETIGKNYFSAKELEDIFNKSYSLGVMCSFVMTDPCDNLKGIRLAFAPGNWSKGKGSKLRADLWRVDADKVGYFQSLFIAKSAQGKGWGPKLSALSIEAFSRLGAKAIVTHAWKESPNNSSVRYLSKFGFQFVAAHPNYWIDVDYECVRDGKPCRCTAEEMIKYL